MKIGIVGAGVAGLTAGYYLSQKGHQVVVFEKENFVGGLAAGFKKEGWDWRPENFFHHFFTSDDVFKNLISELGLSDKLFFGRPKSSIYYDGQISQFDSPLSVLKFPRLSFSQKFRTGLVTSYLKTTNDWQSLEKTTAQEWLKKFYGRRTYEVLWEPLLESKFGDYAGQISMAWFWARIKKRSTKLGYIEGGFQVLIDALVDKIKTNSGEIILNHKVVDDHKPDYGNRSFDRVISTVPIKSEKFKMIGALNLILVLKEKFLTDGTYWLNINDPNFPFVAVVDHTNLVSPKHYGGSHVLYIGGYYPQNHRYFKMRKEEIFAEFLPHLKKINSSHTLNPIPYTLSTSLFAQPVIPVNYSKTIPSMETSDPKIFRANMQMVYPWDRGVNYAIELGQKVADEVVKDLQ